MLPKTVEHFIPGLCYNKELRRKIKVAIGEYDELLTLVKKRKPR